jgi:hypothetical protein
MARVKSASAKNKRRATIALRPENVAARKESLQPQYRRGRIPVLLLGMATANIRAQFMKYRPKSAADAPSAYDADIDLIRSLVSKKILTVIYGRDLARILSLEKLGRYNAYSVGLGSAAIHLDSQHLNADFNGGARFVETLKNKHGVKLFSQIILDYFWIPPGTWTIEHWKRKFFNETIPSFVTEGLLAVNGVVFLPFCTTCFIQLVSCLINISKEFTIHLLRRGELEENLLWRATEAIDPIIMCHEFEKSRSQEEIYCKVTMSDLNNAGYDHFVTKDTVIEVFNKIESPEEVRFFALRRKVGNENGGFIHLRSPPSNKRARK